MATKREELEDKDSVLNKAQDHEPLFILRGSDPTSVGAINVWLQQVSVIEHLHKMGYSSYSIPSAKVEEAIRLRDLMLAWQQAHPDLLKMPD